MAVQDRAVDHVLVMIDMVEGHVRDALIKMAPLRHCGQHALGTRSPIAMTRSQARYS